MTTRFADPADQAFIVSPAEQRARARARWARLGLAGPVAGPPFEPSPLAAMMAGPAIPLPPAPAADDRPGERGGRPDLEAAPAAPRAVPPADLLAALADPARPEAMPAVDLSGPAPRTRARSVIAAAAFHFGVEADEITGGSRVAHLVEARMAAVWVAHQVTGLSAGALGSAFGGRDHTTILNSLARVEAAIADDRPLGRHTAMLLRRVRAAEAKASSGGGA